MPEKAGEKQRHKQPFTEHLDELRKRLLRVIAFVSVAFLVCFNYSEDIFRYLTLPMRSNIMLKTVSPYLYLVPREKVHDLVFLGPAEAFWVHMKISLIAGVIVCVPLIFWQVWAFISPGLLKKEKRLAIPFIAVTSGLFLLGTMFCFLIVLPFAMKFLLNFKTELLTPMIAVEKYIDFCLKFILGFGVVFELPVVIVFITRMGLVSVQSLARNRKYAVLLAFVAAALLTPTPDAFNQTLMAVPIIVLYEGGLIAARIFSGKRGQGGEAVSSKDAARSAE